MAKKLQTKSQHWRLPISATITAQQRVPSPQDGMSASGPCGWRVTATAIAFQRSRPRRAGLDRERDEVRRRHPVHPTVSRAAFQCWQRRQPLSEGTERCGVSRGFSGHRGYFSLLRRRKIEVLASSTLCLCVRAGQQLRAPWGALGRCPASDSCPMHFLPSSPCPVTHRVDEQEKQLGSVHFSIPGEPLGLQSGEATPQILHSVLGPSLQEGH